MEALNVIAGILTTKMLAESTANEEIDKIRFGYVLQSSSADRAESLGL